jgi:hypothetical protein
MAAIVFWFFTAPAPRFANATFMLLSVSAIMMLLTGIQPYTSKVGMAKVLCLLFVVGNLNFLGFVYLRYETFKDISLDGWHAAKQVPLDVKVTTSGLRVYVPISGNQCWDAPLPCTPYFNRSLRLRDPDDMSSGFTIRTLESNIENAEQGAALDGGSDSLHPRQ